MFQVSVVQREGEGILQSMHLKEHAKFTVFLNGGATRKRPSSQTIGTIVRFIAVTSLLQ
ncbi:hypothetical protein [Rhizobium changzhiense]|uniref:hypothetical protein n=1 Tax=Rhizobium changzhiense TaxID=2692317 RepID=UPI001FEFAAFC|nr:hypothetical protein [Rhizobium changzhiense]